MPGKKFRFRAPLVALQCRNALMISTKSIRANPANHGIVTVLRIRPVSDFLIVGCQHGWLVVIGYDRGRFEQAVIRTACRG
jgi:hypothetical protein